MTDHKTFTEDEIVTLEGVLKGVTPGPWTVGTIPGGVLGDSVTAYTILTEADGYPGWGRVIVDTFNSGVSEVVSEMDEYGGSSHDEQGRVNTTFIATFDPPTVARLLSMIRQLRSALYEKSTSLAFLQSRYDWCAEQRRCIQRHPNSTVTLNADTRELVEEHVMACHATAADAEDRRLAAALSILLEMHDHAAKTIGGK